ncbi:hypothetical protein EVAR_39464_1 [Eumeta japonica]|uniref:Uncharacterized protein n=1 Tax=Eumeta variegata TaxID=151549 RepID=A0A4C1VYV8_EUMVA|nr:hypothetical protein EVAR_39464_1 [Eumeta japonica]
MAVIARVEAAMVGHIKMGVTLQSDSVEVKPSVKPSGVRGRARRHNRYPAPRPAGRCRSETNVPESGGPARRRLSLYNNGR